MRETENLSKKQRPKENNKQLKVPVNQEIIQGVTDGRHTYVSDESIKIAYTQV